MHVFSAMCALLLSVVLPDSANDILGNVDSERLSPIKPVRSGRLLLSPRFRAPALASVEVAIEKLPGLEDAVSREPKNRGARLALVRGLVAAGQIETAIAEATAWRQIDAYNLVVVRLLGDLHTKAGQPLKALRIYSAVTELLAEDPQAQRALATVLKQQGQVEAARDRMDRAVALRPYDPRLRFELADLEMRCGNREAAQALFKEIVDDEGTNRQIRYPAKQRLAQIYASLRLDALSEGHKQKAKDLTTSIKDLGIKGGSRNDIKIYLSWDTDQTDVDLWVVTPSGEKIKYDHRNGKNGEALFDDVTQGYGPESFRVPVAAQGEYKIRVNYYSGRSSSSSEARGEVVVVLNEGTAQETVRVLPYELHTQKQTVEVARIKVMGSKSDEGEVKA